MVIAARSDFTLGSSCGRSHLLVSVSLEVPACSTAIRRNALWWQSERGRKGGGRGGGPRENLWRTEPLPGHHGRPASGGLFKAWNVVSMAKSL